MQHIQSLFCIVNDDGKVQPSLAKANVSSSIIFYCNSYGPTEWYFSEILGIRVIFYNKDPISRNQELRVDNIKLSHAGYYICLGKYTDEKNFIATSHLTVYGELH